MLNLEALYGQIIQIGLIRWWNVELLTVKNPKAMIAIDGDKEGNLP